MFMQASSANSTVENSSQRIVPRKRVPQAQQSDDVLRAQKFQGLPERFAEGDPNHRIIPYTSLVPGGGRLSRLHSAA